MSGKSRNTNKVSITLPDGSVRAFDSALTGAELAADIGSGLAKAALAIRIGGEMMDLSTVLDADAEVAIVTARDDDALDLLRHDCAHVMAQAVQELFPGTQATIGPVIKDGFFYDFCRKPAFTEDDLAGIEARMLEIVARDEAIRREVWDRDEAIAHFSEIGEAYKAEIIADIPAGEDVSIYWQGEWKDLCRDYLQSANRSRVRTSKMGASCVVQRHDIRAIMEMIHMKIAYQRFGCPVSDFESH